LLAVPAAWAQDRVRFFDRAQQKEVETTGTIEKESPAGIAIGSRTVPAGDVVDVVYDALKQSKLDYTSAASKERTAATTATAAERQKALGEAQAAYQDLLRTAPAAAKAARRHIQYRLALIEARLAEDDATRTEGAARELKEFLTKYPDAWQIFPGTRALARLQVKTKQVEEARRTYEELARLPGLPQEIRQECALLAVEALLQDRDRLPEAEQKLQAIAQALPADDPQRARVQVYLARCTAAKGKDKLPQVEQELVQTIEQSKDHDLKALAYNTLGDCYLLYGRTKDALYAYLWVDLIYSQNKEQHHKALAQLARVFDDLKDEKRAKEFRDRLRREQ
jgi:tetratricopeptide (TPR) repeat protein